ncbi:M16 family metallopeptidase [Salaquimonas pukyongi]|uniref:M16 family metallopeptidase n=1 Tax=Salaquimonas pukyongi TaxID=2712698 RepID=UPI00096BBF9B|nr:pitrilysin family protein [Salaquimonas pukyongi]
MTVEVTKIGNGLTVALHHMPHLETVAFGTWVKAGARDEAVDEHGIAHLLEHMAFKGTKTRNARQIVEQIEDVGGDINAATSVETTAYHARMMASDIDLGLEVLQDILQNSVFDEKEMVREKHVILQEIGAANDQPDDLVFDLFQDAAFGGQAIGRPILGTRETVRGFTRDDLQSYLDTHYRAPNMVVSVAGKIDSPRVLSMIESLYADYSPKLAKKPKDAFYVGGQQLVERDIAETQIILGFEGRAYQARDFYASQLLSTILGGGMSSRLFQEVREKYGYCYSIFSFNWNFSDTGVFGVAAATEEEDLPKLLPVILDELLRATEHISQEEVDRARAQIKAGLMMSMESPATRAGAHARQLLLFGRTIPNEELIERLEAISPARLRELAGQLFTESAPTIAAVGKTAHVMDQESIAGKLGSTAALRSAAE